MDEKLEKRSVKIPAIVWDINMQCKKEADSAMKQKCAIDLTLI